MRPVYLVFSCCLVMLRTCCRTLRPSSTLIPAIPVFPGVPWQAFDPLKTAIPSSIAEANEAPEDVFEFMSPPPGRLNDRVAGTRGRKDNIALTERERAASGTC